MYITIEAFTSGPQQPQIALEEQTLKGFRKQLVYAIGQAVACDTAEVNKDSRAVDFEKMATVESVAVSPFINFEKIYIERSSPSSQRVASF